MENRNLVTYLDFLPMIKKSMNDELNKDQLNGMSYLNLYKKKGIFEEMLLTLEQFFRNPLYLSQVLKDNENNHLFTSLDIRMIDAIRNPETLIQILQLRFSRRFADPSNKKTHDGKPYTAEDLEKVWKSAEHMLEGYIEKPTMSFNAYKRTVLVPKLESQSYGQYSKSAQRRTIKEKEDKIFQTLADVTEYIKFVTQGRLNFVGKELHLYGILGEIEEMAESFNMQLEEKLKEEKMSFPKGIKNGMSYLIACNRLVRRNVAASDREADYRGYSRGKKNILYEAANQADTENVMINDFSSRICTKLIEIMENNKAGVIDLQIIEKVLGVNGKVSSRINEIMKRDSEQIEL